MDSCKTGIISIVITLWCLIIFHAPLYVFAETPIDHIKTELKSSELDTRKAAVEKLRHRKDEETVDLLISLAGNRWEDWQVQVKAIQFLGEAKNPKALNLLLRIFNSHSRYWECPAIKSYTALALSNFGREPGVTDALTKGLHNSELLTRDASIQALGIIKDEKTLPSLVPLLQDKSVTIRLGVIRALENIGDRQVIPVLKIIAADDNDEVVRETAKFVLTNFNKN
jgi:HEAT repeat protein